MIAVDYALNEFGVELTLRDSYALRYFDGFFNRATTGAAAVGLPPITVEGPTPVGSWPDWRAEVARQQVSPVLETALTCFAKRDKGYLVWCESAERYYALTGARRFLRDLWLAERVCRSPVAFLHAASVELDGRVVIFVGDKRAGKTSLLLDAVLKHGWRVVSNDCLVLYYDHAELHATGLPTYVGIRADVAERYDALLRSRVIGDEPNLDSYQRWRSAKRGFPDARLYLSMGALSSPSLATVCLNRAEITVAAVQFGAPGEAVGLSTLATDPGPFLRQNQKYTALDQLPHVYPVPQQPLSCQHPLLSDFASRAQFIRYRHRGGATELLDLVAAGTGHMSPPSQDT